MSESLTKSKHPKRPRYRQNMQNMTIRVPAAMRSELDKEAKHHGIQISEYVRQILEQRHT